MLVGYMRGSKTDGSQSTDLQRDALLSAGVAVEQLYEDQTSRKNNDWPQLVACLKTLRAGDTLLVWKLDRLGRNLPHLVNTVHDLSDRGIGLKILTGQGSAIDTTTPSGTVVFGIFAALAEFDRELISGPTVAGLASAGAGGGTGRWQYKMTPAKLHRAVAALRDKATTVVELCEELGIKRQLRSRTSLASDATSHLCNLDS